MCGTIVQPETGFHEWKIADLELPPGVASTSSELKKVTSVLTYVSHPFSSIFSSWSPTPCLDEVDGLLDGLRAEWQSQLCGPLHASWRLSYGFPKMRRSKLGNPS